jgi:hypothetical protein
MVGAIILYIPCGAPERVRWQGWRHLAGFSTGVFAQSGLGLIADPMMTSQHRPVSAPARSADANRICPYLYQIGYAEVELNRYGSADFMWDRITSFIGVFVPQPCDARNSGCGGISDGSTEIMWDGITFFIGVFVPRISDADVGDRCNSGCGFLGSLDRTV